MLYIDKSHQMWHTTVSICTNDENRKHSTPMKLFIYAPSLPSYVRWCYGISWSYKSKASDISEFPRKTGHPSAASNPSLDVLKVVFRKLVELTYRCDTPSSLNPSIPALSPYLPTVFALDLDLLRLVAWVSNVCATTSFLLQVHCYRKAKVSSSHHFQCHMLRLCNCPYHPVPMSQRPYNPFIATNDGLHILLFSDPLSGLVESVAANNPHS